MFGRIRFRIRGYWSLRQLVRFQNRSAVYALDVFGFAVFGDQPRACVFAGGSFGHRSQPGANRRSSGIIARRFAASCELD